jgi:hypothetical protein
MADSLGLIADYTQGTDANKPLWSRSDNKENKLTLSEAPASWPDNSNVTWSGTVMTATAGNSNHKASISTNAFRANQLVASQQHRWVVEASYVNHQWAWIGADVGVWSGVRVDLQNGLIDSELNLIGSATIETISTNRYRITFVNQRAATGNGAIYVTFGTSSIASGTTTYNAVGTEQIDLHFAVCQDVNADPTYLPTTDHPQYAGVNGRRWPVFNGGQSLGTSTTLASLFTTTDSIQYIAVQPFRLSTLEYVSRSSPSGIIQSVYTNTSSFRLYDNDGTNKFATSPAASAGTTYIIRARKTGGNLIIGIDSGAGFVEGTPEPCGASSALTSTFAIGATTSGFYGKIGGIFTDNVGTPDTEFEQRLRSYYL